MHLHTWTGAPVTPYSYSPTATRPIIKLMFTQRGVVMEKNMIGGLCELFSLETEADVIEVISFVPQFCSRNRRLEKKVDSTFSIRSWFANTSYLSGLKWRMEIEEQRTLFQKKNTWIWTRHSWVLKLLPILPRLYAWKPHISRLSRLSDITFWEFSPVRSISFFLLCLFLFSVKAMSDRKVILR